jgi:serine/threonine protein kinase
MLRQISRAGTSALDSAACLTLPDYLPARGAKAASALNHPNIVHIYDIAEADGIQFIAMEFVPGKTLDQMIGRKGLRLREALKYAVQTADALAKAF